MASVASNTDISTAQSPAVVPVRDGGSAASNQSKSPASASSGGAVVTVTLSSNAQRLQTATANLASDEASQSTGGLAAEWNHDLANSVDSRSEISADAEINALSGSDPEHLAQAKATQEYVKARIISGGNPENYGANPFAGLSQTSLAAIANDKSGLYTSYEKSAALYESSEQTNAWVMSHANDPQGQGAGFYEEAIQQYGALSPLQQSVYPADYVQNLEIERDRDLGYKDSSRELKADSKNVKHKKDITVNKVSDVISRRGRLPLRAGRQKADIQSVHGLSGLAPSV